MESIKNRLKNSIDQERKFEPYLERFSRLLWPWAESRLLFFVSLLAILDYVSTYAALRLSGNDQVYEAGLLAGWALNIGGFPALFLVDLTSIGTMILLSLGIRALYSKWGFQGFGRAGFVFLLIPYSVIIMGIVINNVLLTFR